MKKKKNLYVGGFVATAWVRPAHRSADHMTPPPKYATVSQLKPQLKILISESREHTSDRRREARRERNEAKRFTFLLGGSYNTKKRRKNTVAWGEGRRVCRAPGASFILLPAPTFGPVLSSSSIQTLSPRSLNRYSCFQTGSGSGSIHPEATLLSGLGFFRKVER